MERIDSARPGDTPASEQDLEEHKLANTSAPTIPGKTMKAVVFHGKQDLRYQDVPEPSCGPGQIKIQPAWCGICGTDLHEYMGGPSICPTEPHPITGEKVPLTFGHEFSGVIEELGEGVPEEEFAVGDRVVVQPIIYDGDCGACKEGLINCCYNNGFVGLSGWGGGLSTHIVVPAYAVHRLPPSIPLDIAALIEPLAVGWHAVSTSPFKPTDTVLVIGGGPIGLSVIQALRARNAHQIIVSEVSAMRKQYAKDFGAHVVLDPTVDDIVARCRELSPGGQGVDVSFDAAGVQVGLDAAVAALRARGTHVNIAIWEQGCRIFPNDWVFREKRYLGVATYGKGDFGEVIGALADGRLMGCGQMITKKVGMGEVVEEGFRALVRDKEGQVKILVKGSGEI